ncbi:MAG: rod shape-determining protein MreC [Prevotellaceae bacterium]|jgi:rod shape-determining protein MreC|nr:rod shape-determining protein MreC [Prevotellaceae bacterium]
MRNLLDFLAKYNYWFLFLLLEAVGFVLLFYFNSYQHSAFFTSAGSVTGRVYQVSGAVNSYFHLKATNAELLDRNIRLEQHIAALEQTLRQARIDTARLAGMERAETGSYRIYPAEVIKNSINRIDNYITLDKGSADSIRPDMGVVSAGGVVGIVYKVSTHFASVISLLNSKSSISCKMVGSDYFGYLKWEYGDSRYAYLRDLPRHAEFSVGDTVVTSGYSTVFPAGIMVGTIADIADSHDGLSYILKIELASDFGRLSDVRVIARTGQQEQLELENETLE